MRSNQRVRTVTNRNYYGKRGNQPRLPFQQRRKNPALLLGVVSPVLLIAAAITYLAIYYEGNEAQKNAQDLLNRYNQAAGASPSAPPPSPGAATQPPELTKPAPTATMLPLEDGYIQPEAPEVDPKDVLVSLPGYDVIGKLRIESIEVELPVIAKLTTKALKVSICWYGGAMPGEKGNMIITGHNYKSGAHFGRLDRLKAGDEVVFDGPDGTAYRYQVYETQVVTPDNVAALDKASGDHTLTLLTCASSGNRRLIVRCRMEE